MTDKGLISKTNSSYTTHKKNTKTHPLQTNKKNPYTSNQIMGRRPE